MTPEILKHSRVRAIFGAGTLRRLGQLIVDEGGTKALLVTDPGIIRAGHAARAEQSLHDAGVEVTTFSGVAENPTTEHVAAGVEIAQALGIDVLIGLGGGSSMDCAKGVNFILTNGGSIQDYWGVGKATRPMLPMIAVPTTAGTGSEAQSYALITDPDTHQKMACGDEKALPRVAILDPELTATVPRAVAAATSIDAVSHAIETAGTTRRNPASQALSREAWRLLESSFETAISNPADESARSSMLLGAHFAGVAIEKSMLGAAHACANPLTSEFGVVHGVAVGLMLPHVIRFNASNGTNPYSDLMEDANALAQRVEHMLTAAALPTSMADLDIGDVDPACLAEIAAQQWTAQFNPRPLATNDFIRLYQAAK